MMELCSEPEWLLLQLLGWKARGYTRDGHAIEFWVGVLAKVRSVFLVAV